MRECYHRYGFEAIDLGALPAREQVAAVRHAEVLAGPHGAALVHAMLLGEHGTVVECFSPKYNNPSIFEICRLLRHRYFQIVHRDVLWSPYQHGDNVLIDLSHLHLTFEEIESGCLSAAGNRGQSAGTAAPPLPGSRADQDSASGDMGTTISEISDVLASTGK